MLIHGTIKVIFAFILTASFFNNMHGMEKQPPVTGTCKNKHTVFFDIRLALYCSMENEPGKKFLEKLDVKKIENESYFSFMQKPFQSNHNTGLLNPDLHEYNVEIKKSYSKKFNFYYLAHIGCKGKITADGITEQSDRKNTFLENAIIAAILEKKADKNLNDVESDYPHTSHAELLLPTTKIPSLQERLQKIIKKELTYTGNNKPRLDDQIITLQRYFPATLCAYRDITIAKFLYHKLLGVTYSQDICGNTIALPAVNDSMAKVVCEKYDFTVYSH